MSGMCSLWVTLGQLGGQELSKTGKAKRKEESCQVCSGIPCSLGLKREKDPCVGSVGSGALSPFQKLAEAQGGLDLLKVFIYPAQPQQPTRLGHSGIRAGMHPKIKWQRVQSEN